MRGQDLSGRFDSQFEVSHIGVGIGQDLEHPIGQTVLWWTYAPDESDTDPVYDVGSYDGGGRRWNKPFVVPVVQASINQGPQYQNDRGFYTMDNLTLVINAPVVYRLLPNLMHSPDGHILDRITYRGELFQPTTVYPKGHIHDHLVVVRIDADQVKPEEVVNDPQFVKYGYDVLTEDAYPSDDLYPGLTTFTGVPSDDPYPSDDTYPSPDLTPGS